MLGLLRHPSFSTGPKRQKRQKWSRWLNILLARMGNRCKRLRRVRSMMRLRGLHRKPSSRSSRSLSRFSLGTRCWERHFKKLASFRISLLCRRKHLNRIATWTQKSSAQQTRSRNPLLTKLTWELCLYLTCLSQGRWNWKKRLLTLTIELRKTLHWRPHISKVRSSAPWSLEKKYMKIWKASSCHKGSVFRPKQTYQPVRWHTSKWTPTSEVW